VDGYDRTHFENNVIMTNHERHQKMMFDILNNFDFPKVHVVMKSLHWTWYPKGVPTVDDIIFSARERIESVIKACLLEAKPDETYFVSSGGLKATAIKNDYGQIEFLQLEFVVTSWDLNNPYDII
jgi:hypothetical protein